MKRVIFHWAADKGTFNASAAKHYHFYADKYGKIHSGNMVPEDNLNCRDGRYAAHTRGTNTGSIGVAAGGMYGAKSNTQMGSYPVTKKSWMAAAKKVAELCEKYDIPVTPKTVLTHAEVETNLGIKQRGKWDYTVVPWMPSITGARQAGDRFRADVKTFMGDNSAYVRPAEVPTKKVDRDRNRYLQKLLIRAGYELGDADGWVGTKTKAAIRAFCKDRKIDYNASNPFSKEVVAALRKQEQETKKQPAKPVKEMARRIGAEDRMSTTEAAQGVSAISGATMPIVTLIKDGLPQWAFTGIILICFFMLIGGVLWTIKERRKYKAEARRAQEIIEDVENEDILLDG